VSISRPQRVAHIVRKWNPLEWGGTETYVASVTRALQRVHWQSEVHAPSCKADACPSGLEPTVILRRFTAINPYIASSERRAGLLAVGGNLITLDEPLRLLRDETLAIAHLHTAGRIGGAVRFAMRLRKRPYVLSVHGPLLSDPVLVAQETERRRGRAIDVGAPVGALLGSRRVLDDAAAILCFNDAERRAIETRFGDRVHRMDHGVDVDRYAAGDARLADARWPQLRGKRVLLVLGRISRQKNQRFAVEALASSACRNAVLVLAGAETDPGYLDETLALAARLGLADRVFALGNVPRDEVADLLARADALLVPSTHEAFGLVVLEGWAARRPVLFADSVGLRELAEPLVDRAVCVRAGVVSDWGAAIDRVLSDAERANAWAQEGRSLCERRFSWDVVASKLAEVYQRAIERSSNHEGRRAA
jgi:glycosyltransferase involved in cell wall biosynthesis